MGSVHLHYFKVTFPSSNAMQDAAEIIQRHAQHHPMLLLGDPPLVLWTDPDIFAGVALYTTKPGIDLLPEPTAVQVRPIDVSEIPVEAHFVVGNASHGPEPLPGTIM
jgi:hypothetical protein